jgi:hypothetical protein
METVERPGDMGLLRTGFGARMAGGNLGKKWRMCCFSGDLFQQHSFADFIDKKLMVKSTGCGKDGLIAGVLAVL